MKECTECDKSSMSVAGVLTRQLATAIQIPDYQLIMRPNRSLNNISMTHFYFLGTHNSSPRLADAFWLVGRLSHGTGVVLPTEEIRNWKYYFAVTLIGTINFDLTSTLFCI